MWKADNVRVLEELKKTLRQDYEEMWKADRAEVLEELKKKLRQDYGEMWKADNIRVLEEFKEKLGKDSLWDPSYDTIFEIFKSCCTEHLTVSDRNRMIELARLESMKEIIQIFGNALKIYSDEFLEELKSYDPKEDLKQRKQNIPHQSNEDEST
ncbi:unnamed protein product [Adineta steineri]|uniref:Uncharacterized protein n=1 Tax=Adineta steineri TaxID=433720 RepID=A0A818I6M7_9BILA|nr:unnamed protein product [Adineta steineri]